jgi:uncharacterized protein (TIGR03067 family)
MLTSRWKTGAVVSAAVLLMAAAVAGLPPAVADPPSGKATGPKGDRAPLQGSWVAAAVEEDGQKLSGEPLKAVRVVVQGDEITFHPVRDRTRVTFNLDPAQSPRTISMTVQDGPDKGKSIPGIYDFQGDRLRLCAALKPGVPRPKEFAAPSGSGLLLLVLQREPEVVRAEREKLQGIWKMTAAEIAGQDVLGPGKGIKNGKLVVRGTELFITRNDYDTVTSDYVLDPTQKPRTMDFVPRNGPENERGRVHRAIYKLDGDTLTVCVNGPDLERPTEFKSAEGTQIMLFTLKRRGASTQK